MVIVASSAKPLALVTRTEKRLVPMSACVGIPEMRPSDSTVSQLGPPAFE